MALDNVHLRKLVELCDSHNYWLFFFFLFKCSWGTAEQLTRQHGGHSGGSWDAASHWDLLQEHRVLSAVPTLGWSQGCSLRASRGAWPPVHALVLL